MTVLRAGTRGSELALRQADSVCAALRRLDADLRLEPVVIRTAADLNPELAIGEGWPVGGFVGAIEQALLDGEIDFAVHSLKDLPSAPTRGLVIAATPPRAAVHDVLIGGAPIDLERMPEGYRVGTSSPRRAAQMRSSARGVVIVPLRGNVPARLRKIGRDVDGVVLAAAGLERLGVRPAHAIDLPVEHFVPAPGQGALAVQARSGDADLCNLLLRIHDEATWRSVSAERAFLARLGAGCRTPAAALGRDVGGGAIELHAQIWSADGDAVVGGVERGADAEAVGAALADRLKRELGHSS